MCFHVCAILYNNKNKIQQIKLETGAQQTHAHICVCACVRANRVSLSLSLSLNLAARFLHFFVLCVASYRAGVLGTRKFRHYNQQNTKRLYRKNIGKRVVVAAAA